MKKALVIYNPVAGFKNPFDVPKLIRNELKKHDFECTWFETQPIEKQPLGQCFNREFDLILVAGGDGTVREVACFMIENKIKTPLALIPLGTANILVQTLGIPLFPPQRAIRFALEKKAHPLDAMRVNNAFSAFIAVGKGYDSVFMKGATRNLKRKYGFFTYIFSFLHTFFPYKSYPFTLVVDGVRHHVLGKLVVVFNGLSLPGLAISRNISPNDGELDVMVLNPRSLYEILKIVLLYPVFRNKKRAPKIQVFQGKNISITQKKGKGKNKIQFDGEIIPGRNVQIVVQPQILNIVYEKKFNR